MWWVDRLFCGNADHVIDKQISSAECWLVQEIKYLISVGRALSIYLYLFFSWSQFSLLAKLWCSPNTGWFRSKWVMSKSKVNVVKLGDIREKYFTVSSVRDLFKRVDNHSVIDFIEETRFYHQLWCLLLQFYISFIALVLHLSFIISWSRELWSEIEAITYIPIWAHVLDSVSCWKCSVHS